MRLPLGLLINVSLGAIRCYFKKTDILLHFLGNLHNLYLGSYMCWLHDLGVYDGVFEEAKFNYDGFELIRGQGHRSRNQKVKL